MKSNHHVIEERRSLSLGADLDAIKGQIKVEDAES
jgi:hypothetical protein